MIKEDALCLEMIKYFSGDPKRIQHFIKVHSFSRLIGTAEGLSHDELRILESAAYVHDIGIKSAEEIYGRCDGKLQEELGPKIAEGMLKKLSFEQHEIERICYLVAHHHTYSEIDAPDYQILVEADFLVNLYEDNCSSDAVKAAYENIFKTESGKTICRQMFSI
jgi:HD superfamily phosphodiesterase